METIIGRNDLLISTSSLRHLGGDNNAVKMHAKILLPPSKPLAATCSANLPQPPNSVSKMNNERYRQTDHGQTTVTSVTIVGIMTNYKLKSLSSLMRRLARELWTTYSTAQQVNNVCCSAATEIYPTDRPYCSLL